MKRKLCLHKLKLAVEENYLGGRMWVIYQSVAGERGKNESVSTLTVVIMLRCYRLKNRSQGCLPPNY